MLGVHAGVRPAGRAPPAQVGRVSGTVPLSLLTGTRVRLTCTSSLVSILTAHQAAALSKVKGGNVDHWMNLLECVGFKGE